MKSLTNLLCPFFFFLLAMLTTMSCKNEDPPKPECTTPPTTRIFYLLDIRDKIDSQCATSACHSGVNPTGGISLQGYGNVKRRADDGSLFGAISHSPGYSPMPKDRPKLPNCTILLIRGWIDQDAPEH
jgi:hypothetical protein